MVMTQVDPKRRGQILLVGAVAIAFVIIGLALLFNAVTYTGQSSVPEAGSSVDDASQFDFEARRGARELLLRVNHAAAYENRSTLAANVTTNVSNYSAIMGATYSAHGAAVNVSVDNATSEYGRRIVQSESAYFTDDGSETGIPNPQLVEEADHLGWTVVTVNGSALTETESNAFTVNVSNVTGEYVEYRIYSDDGGVVNVSVDANGTMEGPYQFNTTRGHVVLDLLDGTSPMNRSARMTPIHRLDGPYNVTVENGDEGRGLYSIVVPDEDSVEDAIGTCPAASGPCHAPTMWNVTVTTSYRSPSVNMTHNQTIPVYNSTTT